MWGSHNIPQHNRGKVISRIYLLGFVGVDKFMGPVEHIVLEFMGVVEDFKG